MGRSLQRLTREQKVLGFHCEGSSLSLSLDILYTYEQLDIKAWKIIDLLLFKLKLWIKGMHKVSIFISCKHRFITNFTFSFRQNQSSDQVECIFGPPDRSISWFGRMVNEFLNKERLTFQLCAFLKEVNGSLHLVLIEL